MRELNTVQKDSQTDSKQLESHNQSEVCNSVEDQIFTSCREWYLQKVLWKIRDGIPHFHGLERLHESERAVQNTRENQEAL